MKGSGFAWGEGPAAMTVPESPGEFFMGRVVSKHVSGHFGHIIGFSRNGFGELFVKVLWCDGSETTIHPSNINLH